METAVDASVGDRCVISGQELERCSEGTQKIPVLGAGQKDSLSESGMGSDLTYIRLPGAHLYLLAIVDAYSRMVLSLRLSNILDTRFCIEALEEALALFGEPAILNTDQGRAV